MATEPFDTIFSQFPAGTAQQWKEKILADLKGNQFENLISNNPDHIPILPFYTKEDAQKYQLAIPAKKNKGWLIAERIKVIDVKQANADALNALQNGTMSLVFDLQNKEFDNTAIKQLLNGILLGIAPVCFENYSKNILPLLESLAPGSCPDTVWVPQLESKTDELTFAILKGMERSSKTIRIHFQTGNHFFLEIAKLRAFRWLWQQVNDIHKTQKEFLLYCETGIQNRSDESEPNNILRNTTEAMSAVIGGCDALLVNPHNYNENSVFGKRIARNVQHILWHESGFASLDDTGKGAYYVEYLTWFLSNKVWEKLQAS